MMAAAGYAGILVALGSAVGLVVQGTRAHRHPDRFGTKALRLPVYGILAGAVIAMGALEVALLTDDFSIEYVANNHSVNTPLIFTIASAWAALEGSIVLWGLVLAGFTVWVFRSVPSHDRLGVGALAIMGLVAIFFFGLMATAANPFAGVEVAPVDGAGPNPLLQNHILMAIHPPMLYLGFVGLTVPFAFAISALIAGEGGSAWLARTRRWTLVAWIFLTAGIVLGALWSYAVLGWGGYWAWDPVENTSFLPWLTATAFVHSSVVQRRRGMLQAWNVALVISTFALTILGTFLTRSGVVASVHSFTQSAIGPAFLAFLAVILVGSFGLFAARAHLVASSPRLESLASREGAFLLNNLLLTLFAFTVLLGTLYPILVEAFSGDQVSVGAPFFDRVAIPISFVLLLAMGLGPVIPYRAARASVVWERVRTPLRAGLISGAGVVLAGARSPSVVVIVVLATFVIAAIIRNLWASAAKLRKGDLGWPGALARTFRNDPGYWGGQVSHVGLALVTVAIAFSGSFGVRETIALSPGQAAEFDGYTLVYDAPFAREEPNRSVVGATIELYRGERRLAVMRPRLNQFTNQIQAIPTPAVRTGIREDVYLSLIRIDAGGIALDAYRYPLMWLLWTGGFITVAGGVWAFAGRKRRRSAGPERELPSESILIRGNV